MSVSSYLSTALAVTITGVTPQNNHFDVNSLNQSPEIHYTVLSKATLTYSIFTNFKDEIKELSDIDEDGGFADAVSLKNALNFAGLIEHYRLKLPMIDLFPTNEIAFVWREQTRGIMSIVFDKTGKTYFSCYFATTEAVRKGNIVEKNIIPNDIETYIKAMSESI